MKTLWRIDGFAPGPMRIATPCTSENRDERTAIEPVLATSTATRTSPSMVTSSTITSCPDRCSAD